MYIGRCVGGAGHVRLRSKRGRVHSNAFCIFEVHCGGHCASLLQERSRQSQGERLQRPLASAYRDRVLLCMCINRPRQRGAGLNWTWGRSWFERSL